MSDFARDQHRHRDEERPEGYDIQEARMLSVASRVPERLRFARKETSVEIVSDISEFVDSFGQDATNRLIAPVEDAITSAGWIARLEYGFPKGLILLQLIAWRPRELPPE